MSSWLTEVLSACLAQILCPDGTEERLQEATASTGGGKELVEQLVELRTLCGEVAEGGEVPEECVEQVRNMVQHGTLLLLLCFLPKFDFEARKEVCKLFESLLNRRDRLTALVVEHIVGSDAIREELFRGYGSGAAVINGTIVRACIKHKSLATQILRTEGFWSLFAHMTNNNFDVASDAVTTFKELIENSETKKTTAEFLDENYERFCKEYTQLLGVKAPEAYFARRQLLKLLGEILIDRTHFKLMKQYIQSADHLKLMMMLFKDSSSHITFEAFNVFKIFVANPDKSPPVMEILTKNQAKLIQFLESFNPTKETQVDEQFASEKHQVIEEIRKLSAPR